MFDLELAGKVVRPARLIVAPGTVKIVVRSRQATPTRVVLGSVWQADTVLTLGQLLEIPEMRDLLPETALAEGFAYRATESTVLAVEVFRGRGRSVARV